MSGVGDSMDLCVVGGYYGKGKRTNVYGALLLACFDADSEQWQVRKRLCVNKVVARNTLES